MARYPPLTLFLVLVALLLTSSWAIKPEESEQEIRPTHEVSNQKIGVFELKKGNISAKFTNYGATIISLLVPDKYGKQDDVVLGYDTVKEYINDTTYFGAIVGRVANRISGAKFTYKGKQYKLIPNEGNNMLHGGPKGYSRVTWKVDKYYPRARSPFITFSYLSFDGEEGFPGNLLVKVTYKISNDNELMVRMFANPLNKATPVNLAQHTYWNLKGQSKGDILNHKVQIFSSHITPVDKYLIPTGKFELVKGTPYDFLKPHTVGSRINQLYNGYDINYVIDASKNRSTMTPVAIVWERNSGRMMHLWSNQPGLQFYTSNLLRNATGKGGYVYGLHDAMCLETQDFPDAVNHPNFPSMIVQPGETYKHVMLYKFSALV